MMGGRTVLSVHPETSPGPSAGHVEMPTNRIPCYVCTWVVVQSGTGDSCRSRLKIRSSSCTFLRAHREMALAAAGAAL